MNRDPAVEVVTDRMLELVLVPLVTWSTLSDKSDSFGCESGFGYLFLLILSMQTYFKDLDNIWINWLGFVATTLDVDELDIHFPGFDAL